MLSLRGCGVANSASRTSDGPAVGMLVAWAVGKDSVSVKGFPIALMRESYHTRRGGGYDAAGGRSLRIHLRSAHTLRPARAFTARPDGRGLVSTVMPVPAYRP